MTSKLHKSCAFCGDLDYNLYKLRNGIILKGKFICGQCQRDLSSTNVDHEDYIIYKEQVRRILF